MIIDSSAIVSILLEEDGHEALLERLSGSLELKIGAPTVAETGIVLAARLGQIGKTLLARFLYEAGVEVVPLTEAHWGVAVEAFERFGKGRHPAGLNFGDCLTYAMSSASGEPLLFVGNDFPKTDLSLVD